MYKTINARVEIDKRVLNRIEHDILQIINNVKYPCRDGKLTARISPNATDLVRFKYSCKMKIPYFHYEWIWDVGRERLTFSLISEYANEQHIIYLDYRPLTPHPFSVDIGKKMWWICREMEEVE